MITQTVETLEKELEETKSRMAELEEENRELLGKVDDKDDDIKLLEGEKKDLQREIDDLNEEASGKTYFPSKTMYDEMKRDYLLEIWGHYTPQEIEAALPRR